MTKSRLLILAIVIIHVLVFISGCTKTDTGEVNVIGTWKAETGYTTYFSKDGTGKTEGDGEIYEFTWEVASFNDAAKQPREYDVFEFTANLSDSAAALEISWGLSGPEAMSPDGMSGDGFILSLEFDGIDSKFDFALAVDGNDKLVINVGSLGQRLMPKPDTSIRLEWITYTRER